MILLSPYDITISAVFLNTLNAFNHYVAKPLKPREEKIPGNMICQILLLFVYFIKTCYLKVFSGFDSKTHMHESFLKLRKEVMCFDISAAWLYLTFFLPMVENEKN